MTADVIQLRPRLASLRVELSSPGTKDGSPWYFVDLVESDGGATTMWGGHDLAEARRAARECAALADGTFLLVMDLIDA